MQHQETAEKIETLVTSVSDKFIDGVEKTQSNILGKINAMIRDLELNPNKTIKSNAKNLKLLRTIKSDLGAIIVNPAYRKKLDNYLKGFTDLKQVNDRYFTVLSTAFTPTKNLYKEILSSSIEITQTSLTEAGISQNVITPIKEILTQNITGGGLITDLEETLRLYIVGDENRLGRLQRYVTQITRDSLNQYSANYMQAISSDLGLKWYYYSSGIKRDTRSYCEARAGKYFTLDEIKDVPQDWSGRIPGTNSSNILTYRGGFNCLHQFIPVLKNSVPLQYRN